MPATMFTVNVQLVCSARLIDTGIDRPAAKFRNLQSQFAMLLHVRVPFSLERTTRHYVHAQQGIHARYKYASNWEVGGTAVSPRILITANSVM